MEKLSELFENIKERFNNPFVFSFILSWLIFNWPITLAVIWHDMDEVKAEGFNSSFDFIRHNLRYHYSFWFPLLIAIIYSAGVPYVRNLIRLINAKAEKFGNEGTLKINKGASIPFEEYYKLELKTSEKEDALAKMIESAGEIRSKNNGLEFALQQSSDKIRELVEQKRINELFRTNLYDTSFIEGSWILKYNNINISPNEVQYIFKKNKIYVKSDDGIQPQSIIKKYFYDTTNNEIVLLGGRMKDSSKTDVFILRVNDEDYMLGTLNEQSITLQRGKLDDNSHKPYPAFTK